MFRSFFVSLFLLPCFSQPECQSRNQFIIHHEDPLFLGVRVLSFCGSSSGAQIAVIMPSEPRACMPAFQTGPASTYTYTDVSKNGIRSLYLGSFFLLSEWGQNSCCLQRLPCHLRGWWFRFCFSFKCYWKKNASCLLWPALSTLSVNSSLSALGREKTMTGQCLL